MTAPFSDYIAALWVETASGSGIYEQWLNATGSYSDSSPILLEGFAAIGSGRRGKFFIQQANASPYGPTIINGTDGSIAQKLITVTSTTGLYPGASILGPGIPANTVVNRVISSTLLETNAVSTTELSPDWTSVAYGNSVYVAVSGTSSNIAATSTDGITWTKRTLPFVANWNSVCYGATSALFVAVCSDVTTTGGTAIGSRFCATSPDGITWTRRAIPLPSVLAQNWTSVATNGTSFVAVGSLADGTATTVGAYSADGITWSASTMTSAIWRSVTYGAGAANRYVAVSSTTISNWDADGTGTWTNGGAMTSANYLSIAWNGTRFYAVSGSSTVSMWSTDATSWTTGAVLNNSTSRGVAWDGTNFVIVSTTNSVNTSRTPAGTTGTLTNTTMAAANANNWTAVCANGTTLVAVSSSSNLRSAALTSTDSGANWTLQTGTPLDVSLTCYNPYVSQLSNTVEFGDNINGNKVPSGAKVRCPNIMFTSAVPVNIQTASSIVGANMVMTAGGSLVADTCLFDESYNTFNQAETLSLTNVGFSIPPLINESYGVTFNSVGFALEPVRRYYTYSATIGSDGWFTRDRRYGAGTTTWTYLNNASITDFNYCVGSPKALQVAVSSVTAPAPMLTISYTQNSTWSYVRFYALNCVASFQDAFNFLTNFNDNTMEHLEMYGVAPMLFQTSSGNTFTDVRIAEDMFNGYRSFPTTGARIGNDPTAEAKLVDDTKYYLKVRTFYDWNNLSNYAEGRTVSATPFIGSKFFPAIFGAINTATRAVTLTWIRRDPTSSGAAGTTTYQIFRSTSPGFTPSSANRIFDTLTVATVSYLNGFVATITATASPVRTITFAQAGRTITLGGAGAGSFTTAGFVAGGNVVVAGTVSNNGTYTILSFTATVITLTTNHTNLVNETAPNGATLDGQPPVNGTSYYYKLRKYDAILTGISSASGTVATTTLTTAGNFNTGLGSVINLQGISGQTKIRIPVGSTTNFMAANIFPGLTLAGTGIGSGAKVVSIDTAWQITVDVTNSSTFVGTTATLGLANGTAPDNIYVVGPGIARPTRVASVTNSTTLEVDTAFIATLSAQAIFFEYGTDSAEVEVTPSGPTTAAFNFLTQSNDFTHANWVKTNLTATANQVSGPNDIGFGIAAAPTADRLVSTGPTAKAVQTITSYLEVGAIYTFSVYIRCDAHHYSQTVSGKISINTTVATDQAFTASGVWQRISATFTATAVTHDFTIQMTTEGSYIYASSALVNQGSSALVPITTTTVKTAVASGGRTLTFASGIDGANTITASSGDFTAAPAFAIGDSIIVQGTSDNDGTYVLSAVSTTLLTVVPAQPLVTGGGAQSAGSIVGSVLASAAQELTSALTWCRATGGNTSNQGIEVAFAALPTGSFWTELYVGTTAGFTPSSINRVGYTLNLLGASTSFYLLNSNNNIIDTLAQEGYGGYSGTRVFLRGASDNKFLDWNIDFNYGAVPAIGNVANLSNDNIFDDFTVKNFRNLNTSPFISINDSSGLTLQNITIEQANDIPYSLQSLNTILKGVTGANAAQATNATTYFFGAGAFATDGLAIAYQAVYDNIFYELYHSPTTGALHMLFNASSSDTPPYTIVSGTPAFGNNGRLYLRTAGDSIEYTWPYRIYGVSSFRDIILKKNGLDLGSSLDGLESLLVEFKIDTGTGTTYGAYQTATPANLAATSVSTTTGFLLKIRITARPGMLFSTQTNAFVVGEEIEGTTSGATATVDDVHNLTTTSGCVILSNITGSFIPTELVRRNSDNQTRATNVVTNTQFALFPSFNSYIDGLQIFTNTVGPGDYPGRIVDIVLTNVTTGSTYYVYKTSGGLLLGSGTASGATVTIPNVAYVTDFGITIRVRKSSAVTKYLPFETQATVTVAGANVFTSQIEDAIVAASYGSIGSDFTINYTQKRIYHSSGSSVYSVNALYSYLQDVFDEESQLDDTVPMSAQTPTEYTLINGWFMDDESFKYLTGGAVQTSGWTGGVIRMKAYDATGAGTAFGSSDIGKVITETDSGDTGTIMAYDERTATEIGYVWIRPDTLADTFADVNSAYSVATSSAAGVFTAASSTGETIWSNIFSLGTLVSGSTLDVWQNDVQITPWWTSGHIDILVKVKEMGTETDSGNITVLARKYSTLYDHFVIDASTGRNPVPLAAFADGNNETASGTVAGYSDITFDFGASSQDLGNGNGSQPYDVVIDGAGRPLTEIYEYLKYVTRSGSGTTLNGVNGEFYIAVGDYRFNYDTEASGPFVEGERINGSGAVYGYLVSLIDSGATGTMTLRNVHGSFADDMAISGVTSGATAAVNGAPEAITASKQAPFGTFAGGSFFGARGVFLTNMDIADANNYELIDATNTSQVPPATVNVTVGGLVSGDRVSVFRTTGANEIINKTYLASHATTNSAATTAWEATGAIPADTPAAGFIRLVKTASSTEERLEYTSWTGAIFTLAGAHAGGYGTGDTAYVPYIDEQASSTSISKSVTYVSDRTVMTRVRKVGIQPFTTTGSLTSTGYSATAVRTADTIA